MSRCGVIPAARNAATAPMPAITPAAPSKLPPCTMLSRWEPMMIGGAAVTEEWAEEIGATYSADAGTSVDTAKQLAGKGA